MTIETILNQFLLIFNKILYFESIKVKFQFKLREALKFQKWGWRSWISSQNSQIILGNLLSILK